MQSLDLDKYMCRPIEFSIKTQSFQLKDASQHKQEDQQYLDDNEFVKDSNGKKILQDEDIQLKVVQRDQNGKKQLRDINSMSDFKQDPDGLVSLLYDLKQMGRRIKMIICVTIYNEGNNDLETTMRGIQNNIQNFAKINIQPSEILVIAIFDGIDKVNASKKNKEDNIFKNTFNPYDLYYQVEEEQTMEYQKDRYTEAVKWSNISHQELDEDKKLMDKFNEEIARDATNINQNLLNDFMEKLEDQMIKKKCDFSKNKVLIDKFKQEFQKQVEKKKVDTNYEEFSQVLKTSILINYIEDLKKAPNMFRALKSTFIACQENPSNKIYTSQEDYINEKKIEFLKKIRKEGQEYIDQRVDTAWCYQDRVFIQSSKERQNLGADLNYNNNVDTDSEDELNEDDNKSFNDFDSQIDDRHKQNKDNNGQNKQQGFDFHQKEKTKERIYNDFKDSYMNVMYCVKFRNAQKLNSHMWFFEGFCRKFDPKYVVLMDAGLEPSDHAIVKFFLNLEYNKNVGGVCGQLSVRQERLIDDEGHRLDQLDNRVDFLSRMLHRFFSIQKAQQFEYDTSHIIQKAFESLFGFIHVLPGAFSGYKFDAVKTCMGEYLKTELNPLYLYQTLQEANMNLKEDRILSLELYCAHNFTMKYIPNARALVDPINNLPGLMGQRRRWINGNWYVLNYILANYQKKVRKSKHTCYNIFKLYLSMFYAQMVKLVQFFSLAIYFTVLLMMYYEVIGDSALPQPEILNDDKYEYSSIQYISLILYLYFLIVGGMIYFSLNYKVSQANTYGIWYAFSTAFGIYNFGSFIFLIRTIVYSLFIMTDEDNETENALFDSDQKGQLKTLMYVTLIFILAPVVLDSIFKIPSGKFFQKYFSYLGSTLSFIFYAPSYIQMFQIYSFCNIDDLTWGTKGVNSVAKTRGDTRYQQKIQELVQKFEEDKFWFVSKWFILNVSLACLLGFYTKGDSQQFIVLIGIIMASIFIILKCLGAIVFYILEVFSRFCNFITFKQSRQAKRYKKQSDKLNKQFQQIVDQMFGEDPKSKNIIKNNNNNNNSKQRLSLSNQMTQSEQKRLEVEKQLTLDNLKNGKKELDTYIIDIKGDNKRGNSMREGGRRAQTINLNQAQSQGQKKAIQISDQISDISDAESEDYNSIATENKGQKVNVQKENQTHQQRLNDNRHKTNFDKLDNYYQKELSGADTTLSQFNSNKRNINNNDNRNNSNVNLLQNTKSNDNNSIIYNNSSSSNNLKGQKQGNMIAMDSQDQLFSYRDRRPRRQSSLAAAGRDSLNIPESQLYDNLNSGERARPGSQDIYNLQTLNTQNSSNTNQLSQFPAFKNESSSGINLNSIQNNLKTQSPAKQNDDIRNKDLNKRIQEALDQETNSHMSQQQSQQQVQPQVRRQSRRGTNFSNFNFNNDNEKQDDAFNGNQNKSREKGVYSDDGQSQGESRRYLMGNGTNTPPHQNSGLELKTDGDKEYQIAGGIPKINQRRRTTERNRTSVFFSGKEDNNNSSSKNPNRHHNCGRDHTKERENHFISKNSQDGSQSLRRSSFNIGSPNNKLQNAPNNNNGSQVHSVERQNRRNSIFSQNSESNPGFQRRDDRRSSSFRFQYFDKFNNQQGEQQQDKNPQQQQPKEGNDNGQLAQQQRSKFSQQQ